MGLSGAILFVVVDETVGGAVVRRNLSATAQFRKDLIGKLLSKSANNSGKD